MSAVIACCDHNPTSIEKVSQIGIAGTVLSHAMHNMQPTERLNWAPLVVMMLAGITAAKGQGFRYTFGHAVIVLVPVD